MRLKKLKLQKHKINNLPSVEGLLLTISISLFDCWNVCKTWFHTALQSPNGSDYLAVGEGDCNNSHTYHTVVLWKSLVLQQWHLH